MPRKRTTRVKTVAQPPKGTVAVTIDKGISENEKKEQVTIVLKDFDCKVQNVLKDIEKKRHYVKSFILARLDTSLATLPQEVKNMTLKEFALAGGNIDAARSWVRSKKLNRREELESLKSKTALGIINEENSEATDVVRETPLTKPLRGRAKNPTRSKYITPCNTVGKGPWGKTPLITPKFDPNLPSTPDNIREMKPGERLMSLAGSPVEVKQQHTVIKARGNKKEIAAQMSNIAGVDLTPSRVEKMLSLMAETIVGANKKV